MKFQSVHKIVLVFALLGVYSCSSFEGGTYAPMQSDFDKVRIDDAFEINALIQKYKDKTGKYPFEERSKENPIVVDMQSDDQEKRNGDNYYIFVDMDTRGIEQNSLQTGAKPVSVELKEFEKELRSVLGENVSVPVDPQQVPVKKPVIYQYIIYQGVYDVTVYLHGDYLFSRKLSDFVSKFSVGNVGNPGSGIWTETGIGYDRGFHEVVERGFNRGGYSQRYSESVLKDNVIEFYYEEAWVKYEPKGSDGAVNLYGLSVKEDIPDQAKSEFIKRQIFLADSNMVLGRFMGSSELRSTEEYFFKQDNNTDYTSFAARFETDKSELQVVNDIFRNILRIPTTAHYDKNDDSKVMIYFETKEAVRFDPLGKSNLTHLVKELDDGFANYFVWDKSLGDLEFVIRPGKPAATHNVHSLFEKIFGG